jgi:hypothetical protein
MTIDFRTLCSPNEKVQWMEMVQDHAKTSLTITGAESRNRVLVVLIYFLIGLLFLFILQICAGC